MEAVSPDLEKQDLCRSFYYREFSVQPARLP
jgi:hypothetical protein